MATPKFAFMKKMSGPSLPDAPDAKASKAKSKGKKPRFSFAKKMPPTSGY